MGDVQGGYNTGSGCFGADGIRDQESRQRRSVRARKDRTTVPRSQTGTTRPIQSENYTRYIHSPSIKPNHQTCPSHPHLTFSLALSSHPIPTHFSKMSTSTSRPQDVGILAMEMYFPRRVRRFPPPFRQPPLVTHSPSPRLPTVHLRRSPRAV